jgi:MFS family permease
MIAGVLISEFGTGAAFAANALAYVPMIAAAATLSTVRARPLEPREPIGFVRQMRDGFAHATENRTILAMLLSFAAVACTARGIMELAPGIAATVLGGGVGMLSSLMSSIALGALLAGIWISRRGGWQGRTTIIVTLGGSAIGLIGYGASGRIALALMGAALLGFMLAVNNISVTSAIQLQVAPQYRGRINSLYNMIFKGGPAVGAAVFGWLAHLTDIRLSCVTAAFVLVLLMLWILSQTKTVSIRVPTPPSAA